MTVSIYESTYMNIKSLVIESNRMRAAFVPTGSRMVSLFDKKTGREFLVQMKSEVYRRGVYDCKYPGFDAGFDEMFPTIDECYYGGFPWEGIKIPDHGEVWSLDWESSINASEIEMNINGIRFPYKLNKRISMTAENKLKINYRLDNLSPFDMKFIWAAHPMMQIEEGTEILLPPGCKTGYCIVSLSRRLGGYGNNFCISEGIKGTFKENGNMVYKVRSIKTKDAEKYYVKEKLKYGNCSIYYPSDGASVTMDFPAEQVPYLGVLINEGGWYDSQFALLEPCTAPYDRIDVAKVSGCCSEIKGKSILEWHLIFEIG